MKAVREGQREAMRQVGREGGRVRERDESKLIGLGFVE